MLHPFLNSFAITAIAIAENTNSISKFTEVFNDIVDTLQNLWIVIVALGTITLVLLSVFLINKRARDFTKRQIESLKDNGKYIPGIFVELNESKEILRYFLYGAKWRKRIIKKYNYIYTNFYGNILKKANLNQEVRFHLHPWAKMEHIENTIDIALDYHNKFSKRKIKFADAFSESEPLFEIIYHPYIDALEKLQSYTQAASRKYIVLTGSAGNGKTNLLCSIAELALKLKQPVVFVNSRDVKGTIEDYFLIKRHLLIMF